MPKLNDFEKWEDAHWNNETYSEPDIKEEVDDFLELHKDDPEPSYADLERKFFQLADGFKGMPLTSKR